MARHIRTLTRNKQVEIQDGTDKKNKLVFEIRGLGGSDFLDLMEDAQTGNQAALIRKTINAAVVKLVSGITKTETDNSVPDIKDFNLVQALQPDELTALYVKITEHSSLNLTEKKTS